MQDYSVDKLPLCQIIYVKAPFALVTIMSDNSCKIVKLKEYDLSEKEAKNVIGDSSKIVEELSLLVIIFSKGEL